MAGGRRWFLFFMLISGFSIAVSTESIPPFPSWDIDPPDLPVDVPPPPPPGMVVGITVASCFLVVAFLALGLWYFYLRPSRTISTSIPLIPVSTTTTSPTSESTRTIPLTGVSTTGTSPTSESTTTPPSVDIQVAYVGSSSSRPSSSFSFPRHPLVPLPEPLPFPPGA